MLRSNANATLHEIHDDNGKLTGEPGATVEMTIQEIADKAGLKLETARRRVTEQNLYRWSELSRSVQEAMRISRAKFLGQTTAHFGGEAGRRKEKRAHEERVRKGHPSLE